MQNGPRGILPIPYPNMTTLAALRTLHTTIGSALDDIERIYKDKSLDFPSPDVPLYRNDNLDAGFTTNDPAEKLTADPVVTRAASFAVAASGQIINILQNPFFNILEAASGVMWCCFHGCFNFLT